MANIQVLNIENLNSELEKLNKKLEKKAEANNINLKTGYVSSLRKFFTSSFYKERAEAKIEEAATILDDINKTIDAKETVSTKEYQELKQQEEQIKKLKESAERDQKKAEVIAKTSEFTVLSVEKLGNNLKSLGSRVFAVSRNMVEFIKQIPTKTRLSYNEFMKKIHEEGLQKANENIEKLKQNASKEQVAIPQTNDPVAEGKQKDFTPEELEAENEYVDFIFNDIKEKTESMDGGSLKDWMAIMKIEVPEDETKIEESLKKYIRDYYRTKDNKVEKIEPVKEPVPAELTAEQGEVKPNDEIVSEKTPEDEVKEPEIDENKQEEVAAPVQAIVETTTTNEPDEIDETEKTGNKAETEEVDDFIKKLDFDFGFVKEETSEAEEKEPEIDENKPEEVVDTDEVNDNFKLNTKEELEKLKKELDIFMKDRDVALEVQRNALPGEQDVADEIYEEADAKVARTQAMLDELGYDFEEESSYEQEMTK